MLPLTQIQQDTLKQAFREFLSSGISFVVPRGHGQLFAEVPGGDIDLFVHEDDFERANKILSRACSPRRAGSKGRTRLLFQGLRSPVSTARKIVDNPALVVRLLRGRDENNSLRGDVQEQKWMASGLQIHLVNHLAYRSPLNNKEVRVNPEVEERMFSRREVRGLIPAPSPPDEMAHLICRGVFDYEGDFPPHYIDRLETLQGLIQGADKLENELALLLEYIFYDASEVVIHCIEESDYRGLRARLQSYSDY